MLDSGPFRMSGHDPPVINKYLGPPQFDSNITMADRFSSTGGIECE